MAAGPAIMMLSVLWFARMPGTSVPWDLRLGDPGSLVPPSSYGYDVLPGAVLFGLGLSILVAPLTTALMASVPAQNSGVASAINNAISRVGPQLAGAAIFVAITASFYQGLAQRVPALDVSSSLVRVEISPLNQPTVGTSAERVAAAREASTDAFHLAMLVTAALLAAGAVINAVGIRPSPQTPAGSS
jgi:hypothetical protein